MNRNEQTVCLSGWLLSVAPPPEFEENLPERGAMITLSRHQNVYEVMHSCCTM